MEPSVLLEFLKLLWLGFEIARYFVNRKREQALIKALEKQDQRLSQLEEKVKDKP